MNKRFRYYLFLVLITPICFEIALRILGYGPYRQSEYTISSKPNMCLQASNTLGFSLGEGTFKVSVNGGPEYAATHVDGKRVVRLDKPNLRLPKLFVMGCSFTYGMGVSDSVSFPFQLQGMFKEVANIENYGVPGFGNVQSFLQLKTEVKKGNKPGLVIVNFCDFHHERNSLTPRYRNSLVLGYQRSNKEVSKELQKSAFPFIEDGEIKAVSFDEMYHNWPGRETFATIHYFQSNNDKRLSENIDLTKNSLFLFKEMKAFCDQHEIQLIVTGLTRNRATHSFLNQLEKHHIRTVDISLDLTNEKYNQLPYDSHPNAAAHTKFAVALIPVIQDWINSRSLAN